MVLNWDKIINSHWNILLWSSLIQFIWKQLKRVIKNLMCLYIQHRNKESINQDKKDRRLKKYFSTWAKFIFSISWVYHRCTGAKCQHRHLWCMVYQIPVLLELMIFCTTQTRSYRMILILQFLIDADQFQLY